MRARSSHDFKHSKDDKDSKDSKDNDNSNYGYGYPVGDETTSHDPNDSNSHDNSDYPHGDYPSGSYPSGGNANDNGPAACKNSQDKFGKRSDSKAMCCQLDVMGLVSLPCQDGI